MTSYHQYELESGTTDSVASSPRSDHPSYDLNTRARFMCSFGGKILPRPHDNQLRYVGGISNISVKYQLPNEELDALISVTTDEDVDNMMDEYDRVALNQNPKSARLRLFLFNKDEDISRTSSISSLLHGSANREHWFLDAINGSSASGLERGRSEASSIVSEVPDYLFGLDNSEDPQPRGEPKLKNRLALNDNVSVSDPGSPAPVVSSPFCSTSSSVPSVPSIPNLPPVKTKPENSAPVLESKESQFHGYTETVEPPQSLPTGYPGNPAWQYVSDPHYSGQSVQPVPVYYVPGPVPPGNVSVQPFQVRAPYVQQHYRAVPGQIPVGYHHPSPGVGQVYSGGVRPISSLDPYDVSARVVPDGATQQVLYGARNAGMVSAYPGMVVSTGEELHGSGSDVKTGWVYHERTG
ncbi:hypothetical protein FEM48_Zijuj01G0141900 [Ziziphus jujuba var. spinosa]|uniref:PB1 domain-containing protein n=1 Tax=Ziziphus jujuba var. spinosa TaxID=714518 RepID=A0A978W1R0_ZIZJJ|nr:hypothetical protein FEM48_Zijuj01G0141900 [Ziziphus jujuba var. spinosa]